MSFHFFVDKLFFIVCLSACSCLFVVTKSQAEKSLVDRIVFEVSNTYYSQMDILHHLSMKSIVEKNEDGTLGDVKKNWVQMINECIADFIWYAEARRLNSNVPNSKEIEVVYRENLHKFSANKFLSSKSKNALLAQISRILQVKGFIADQEVQRNRINAISRSSEEILEQLKGKYYFRIFEGGRFYRPITLSN